MLSRNFLWNRKKLFSCLQFVRPYFGERNFWILTGKLAFFLALLTRPTFMDSLSMIAGLVQVEVFFENIWKAWTYLDHTYVAYCEWTCWTEVQKETQNYNLNTKAKTANFSESMLTVGTRQLGFFDHIHVLHLRVVVLRCLMTNFLVWNLCKWK